MGLVHHSVSPASTDAETSITTHTTHGGLTYTRLLQVDFASNLGDSGAGLIDGHGLHVLDGLVNIKDDQGNTYAIQAWDALQALGTGANFNCELSGNHGTVCPGYSR